MSDIVRRIASTLADARGRRTLTVLDLDRIAPAERDAAVAAVLDGRSEDSYLARWDRKWLKGTFRATWAAAGAVSLGVGILVVSEGTAGGLLLVGCLPAAWMGMRRFSEHLDSPARIRRPDGLADATTLDVTITPEDGLAYDLWERVHELWTRVSEQSDRVPRAEFSMVRQLAYQAQAEIAHLVAVEKQHLTIEAEVHLRAACSALARLERATALALGLAQLPGTRAIEAAAGMTELTLEPNGVLSEVSTESRSEQAVSGEPDADWHWQPYRRSRTA